VRSGVRGQCDGAGSEQQCGEELGHEFSFKSVG
jgi:hypothetical protein